MKQSEYKELSTLWEEKHKSDPVNNPSHYNKHGIECIQAIRAALTDEEFAGYCKGNALKYAWRQRYKGKPKEDIQKAQWYLNKMEQELYSNDQS